MNGKNMPMHVWELVTQTRVLFLGGEVDNQMANFAIDAINYLDAHGSPPLEVRIASPGGDVSAGLVIYDTLKRYSGKKTGVVYGMAFSMGAIILQACEERIALPNSQVLIHHIIAREISLTVLRDRKMLSAFKKNMERDQQRLFCILEERSQLSLEKIDTVCAQDLPLDAEEALKLNLIDRIGYE